MSVELVHLSNLLFRTFLVIVCTSRRRWEQQWNFRSRELRCDWIGISAAARVDIR